MIKRINFLEKKRFQVTYQTMVTAIGAVLLTCALLYGLLFFNDRRAQARLTILQADIERLKAERERIISQETLLTGEGSLVQVQAALEKSPAWSDILMALAQALPPRVWLASVKSSDKESATFKKEIILNGQAKSPQVITAFLTHLQADPRFAKVVLTTSAQEANGLFQFTIACDIGPKQWILKP